LLYVAGDFNDAPPGALRQYVGRPLCSAQAVRSCCALRRVFDQFAFFTEVTPELPTHYDAKTDALSTIDRIFVSIPWWALPSVSSRVAVVSSPARLFRREISNHAPVTWVVSLRPPADKKSLPLPRRLFRTDAFHRNHKAMVAIAGLGKMNDPERLLFHKDILRSAALLARDSELASEDLGDEALVEVCSSTSSAVYSNNVHFASILVSRSSLAARFLAVSAAQVKLVDPETSCDNYERFKRGAARKKLATLDAEEKDSPRAVRQRIRSQRLGLERLKRLWTPFGKVLALDAMRVGSLVISGTDEILQALAPAWAPTFRPAEILQD